MIEYRPFKNADLPELTDLWKFGQLGPTAATSLTNDTFDLLVVSEPYFDRQGLIVACEGREVAGYVHAGFGANRPQTGLAKETGVISAVIVRPDYRRRGIGRELVSRAEAYLKGVGVREIVAGESGSCNPFYLGLYGGAESAGFLDSDRAAAPFFTALGYVPRERYLLLERNITEKKDPFDPRFVAIRRTMKFGVMDHPPQASWWWMTRCGRFESLTFALVPSAGGDPPALVTFWGMEVHAATRGRRTVGITDLKVAPPHRRKGLARVLVTEVIRRLRDDLISHVEVTIKEDNEPALALFRGLAFEQFDSGVVYGKA